MREKIPTFVLMTILFSSIVLVATGYGGVTATKVYIEPKLIDNQDMSLSTIQVDVMIQNVEDLYTWGVCLKFAPLRTVLAYYETTGQLDFLSGPDVMVFAPTPTENIVEGTLDIGATRMMDVPGVSGSGKLATVIFNVLEAGESPIEIVDSILYNSDNDEIPHNQFDGYYKGPVAQLVRKELPLGRVISLAEGKKQVFLSSVKNFADVPLYVRTKFHMVRDDGMVMDLWPGVLYAYVDDFAYDTVPVRSYHGGYLPTDLSVSNWDMNGTLNEIDGGMIWTQRIYPEDIPLYTVHKYVKRRDTPVVGAVAGTGDGVKTTFQPPVPNKYTYHWTWYVDGVEQVEGVDYDMKKVYTYTEDGKIEYCSRYTKAIFKAGHEPPPGKVVTVDYIWREYNYIGVFSFEDIPLPSDTEIGNVFVEFYAASDGDNNVYRCMIWDGTTWKPAPWSNGVEDVGGWTWYTSVKSVGGILDTVDKINAAKIVISFDYDHDSIVPMWIDCMRLRIELLPQVVQPDEVLEIFPVELKGLATADIGTYTCEATCYFSYYGNKFNPSTKTSTFSWRITE